MNEYSMQMMRSMVLSLTSKVVIVHAAADDVELEQMIEVPQLGAFWALEVTERWKMTRQIPWSWMTISLKIQMISLKRRLCDLRCI